MDPSARKALCVLVTLTLLKLPEAESQEAGLLPGPRKPFFKRFRRLEEQFRRFQEVTLTHLQAIASNYNVSYNVDARFQNLTQENLALALALNQLQAAVQGDLGHLKSWVRKAQSKSHKVDAKLLALGQALSEGSREHARELKVQKEQGDAISGMALDLRALQGKLTGLMQLVHDQGTRLSALQGQMQVASLGTATSALILPERLSPSPLPLQGQRPDTAASASALVLPERLSPSTLQLLGQMPETAASASASPLASAPALPKWLSPSQLQPQVDRQMPGPILEPSNPRQDITGHLQKTSESASAAPSNPHQWAQSPQRPGEICNVDTALVFPNASTENVVLLRPGFLGSLRALSFCSWVRSASGRVGTLLSYATRDNDNKLVLHGRDSLPPGSIHFVIGDPAFRELPLQPLLDGQWHHLCVLWTSTQGRHWLYMDRRLVATGSRFREGYEIPHGGSLVLGQEQDIMEGGFDSAEAFVGSLAGLAIWNRALTPGEVSSLAAGKGVPTGALLTLANVTSVGGFVQKVTCTCLELCP
ncbi:PREDICTED: pentraxin-4 [Elephantulus edwardii]|uniref:pentraxin-4 n=1 Tax=Elephantulus edwardii TaxID=28737 RepID=UPI0003F0D4B7|nr:PREDICTED: pentraxin-4 [Elephantulus edwardii]